MNMHNSIPKTVSDVAKHLGGSIQGDGEVRLFGIMPLKSAENRHLSFLYRRHYIEDVENSKAGAIIVGKDVKINNRTLIIVEDPREGYRKAMEFFYPESRSTKAGISPHAIIDKTAKISRSAFVGNAAIIEAEVIIGDRTIIMAGAIVGEGCKIGNDTVIHYGAVIYPGVTLGDRVVIHAGTVIGSEGFGFQRGANGKLLRIRQVGSVVIEDEVEIGSCTCIDKATLTNTRIGKGSKIDSLVLVGHNVEMGQDVLVIGQTGIAGSAKIGNAVNLYGQVGVRGHVSIGERTTVLARAVVLGNIVPDSEVAGMPAIPASQWRKIVACLKRLPDVVNEHRKKTFAKNEKK